MIVRMAEMNASLVTAVLDSGDKISISPDGFIVVSDKNGNTYSFDLPSVSSIATACNEQGGDGVVADQVTIYHRH